MPNFFLAPQGAAAGYAESRGQGIGAYKTLAGALGFVVPVYENPEASPLANAILHVYGTTGFIQTLRPPYGNKGMGAFTTASSGYGAVATYEYGSESGIVTGPGVGSLAVFESVNQIDTSGAPIAAVLDGQGYSVDYAGNTYGPSGTYFGTFYGAPARGTRQGTALMGAVSASNQIAVLTSSGASGASFAGPPSITTLADIAATSSAVGAIGWTHASLGSGSGSVFAINPANPSLLFVAGYGVAQIWENLDQTANSWTLQTQISFAAVNSLSRCCWTPNGTQIFVTDSTSNSFSILSYVVGVLTVAQTISQTGAFAVVTGPDSLTALVGDYTDGVIIQYQFSGGTWSALPSGDNISLANVHALAPLGQQIIAGYHLGTAILTETAGVWEVTDTLALSFSPLEIAVDSSLNAYLAGIDNIAVINDGAIIGSGSFSGASTVAIIENNGQIAILDETDLVIRLFSTGDLVTWTQSSTVAVPSGSSTLYQAGATVFVGGNSILEYNWGAPFVFEPVRLGSFATYNGTSWTPYSLGADKSPGSITVDPSGNFWVICADNSLYEFSVSATLVSQSAVPNYPGQPSTTPIGAADITWFGGQQYVVCSMAPYVVQL